MTYTYTTTRTTVSAPYTYTAWNPEWATGHSLIDSQHQRWIAAVNELFEAKQSGKGNKEVQRTMKFLQEYTIKHFHDEENLQQKSRYPDYSAHKQIHDNFRNGVHEFARELRLKGPSEELINHICVTIGRWVISHIKSEDFKMAEYVKDKERG